MPLRQMGYTSKLNQGNQHMQYNIEVFLNRHVKKFIKLEAVRGILLELRVNPFRRRLLANNPSSFFSSR
jgi:hypothetical protein